jgi:hypothetical protein
MSMDWGLGTIAKCMIGLTTCQNPEVYLVLHSTLAIKELGHGHS